MNLNNIQIRETATSDFSHIMEVEKLAFGYDKEAELVAELLADNTTKPIVSLLAFYKDEPIGHILFTRAYFNEQQQQPMMHILAPLAVKPEYQRQGIENLWLDVYRYFANDNKYREITRKRFKPCVRIRA